MTAPAPQSQPGRDEAPATLLRGWAKAYRDTPEHRFPSDPHAEFFPVDLEFAAARIEELTKALEWQPIETAPKDRTRILLFQVGRGAFEGWWHTAWPHPEEYWMDDADSEPNPTHWRRTLAPPLEQSGSGK